MLITGYGLTDPGCVRTENEDGLAVRPDLGYYAVVDGMGGLRNGALAAELTLSTIQFYLESSCGRPDVTWPFGYNTAMSLNANRLATAIRLANRQVWKRADERPDFGGMGAAVAAVLIQGDEAAVANLGDSRVYLFREGLLKQLTVDDTWLNVVLADGNLDAAQRARHPMRNVLTQAVGSQNDVDVHTTDVLLRISDLLLLSSDGLHAVVGDDVVRAALANNLPPEDLVERLVHEARAAGGPDNISCVVIGVAHS